MSRKVLYVSGGSALSRLFERALKPLGYDELVYLPEFWRGLSEPQAAGVWAHHFTSTITRFENR